MRAILIFHNRERKNHKTVSTDHNFWREKRAEAVSNRGPFASQPNALPLGQTGSPFHRFSSFSWCLISSDVSWHIRDKLRPTRQHGLILLYVHGNHKARSDGQPRTATSTLTQLLNYNRFTEFQSRFSTNGTSINSQVLHRFVPLPHLHTPSPTPHPLLPVPNKPCCFCGR